MGIWEEAFTQAVLACGCVKEEALEDASNALNYDAVSRAHVMMEGPLLAVRKTLAYWARRLNVEQDALVSEGSSRERLCLLFEPYIAFLFERRGAVLAFYKYLVFNYSEIAFEHVWQVANNAWRRVESADAGFVFYTKRGVLAYAYGYTLHWWTQHQDADFCALMDTLQRAMQQGMRVGHLASTSLKRILDIVKDTAHSAEDSEV